MKVLFRDVVLLSSFWVILLLWLIKRFVVLEIVVFICECIMLVLFDIWLWIFFSVFVNVICVCLFFVDRLLEILVIRLDSLLWILVFLLVRDLVNLVRV